MTPQSICPLVIAKILRVTTESWAQIVAASERSPDIDLQGAVRKHSVQGDSIAIRTVSTGHVSPRNTGCTARPRVAALFSGWGAPPRA